MKKFKILSQGSLQNQTLKYFIYFIKNTKLYINPFLKYLQNLNIIKIIKKLKFLPVFEYNSLYKYI